MLRSVLLLLAAALMPCMSQTPRTPDLEAQRAAMKKLSFLVGNWSGDGRIFRQACDPVEILGYLSAGTQ
ncbi:exported hypothetical protein [Candidatus Sulfopaludibacter sp. SbA3]|nr:exported hypothetical protein [Candidatus Sulfopaludibacter sp. SbA3]